jgi:hypothetical protein
MIPSRSPSIVSVMLCLMPLKKEPTEVAVGLALEEVVVVAALSTRLWPKVEVLSWKYISYEFFIGSGMRTYCDNVVFFHETWLMSSEEAEHGEDESHNGACHGEECCSSHFCGC